MANLERGWTAQVGARTFTELEVTAKGPVKERKSLDPNEFGFALPDDGEVFDSLLFTDQVILRYDGAERLRGVLTTKEWVEDLGGRSMTRVDGQDNWVQLFHRATRDEKYVATDPADFIRRALGFQFLASDDFAGGGGIATFTQTQVQGGKLKLTGQPGTFPTAGTMRATSVNKAPSTQTAEVTAVTLQATDRFGGTAEAQQRDFVDQSFEDTPNSTTFYDADLDLIRAPSVATLKSYPFSDNSDTLATTGAAVIKNGKLTLAGTILLDDFETPGATSRTQANEATVGDEVQRNLFQQLANAATSETVQTGGANDTLAQKVVLASAFRGFLNIRFEVAAIGAGLAAIDLRVHTDNAGVPSTFTATNNHAELAITSPGLKEWSMGFVSLSAGTYWVMVTAAFGSAAAISLKGTTGGANSVKIGTIGGSWTNSTLTDLRFGWVAHRDAATKWVSLGERPKSVEFRTSAVGAAGNAIIRIESDTAGSPSGLLAAVNLQATVAVAVGSNTATFTDPGFVPPGTYWIRFSSDGDTRYTLKGKTGAPQTAKVRDHSIAFGGVGVAAPFTDSALVTDYYYVESFDYEKRFFRDGATLAVLGAGHGSSIKFEGERSLLDASPNARHLSDRLQPPRWGTGVNDSTGAPQPALFPVARRSSGVPKWGWGVDVPKGGQYFSQNATAAADFNNEWAGLLVLEVDSLAGITTHLFRLGGLSGSQQWTVTVDVNGQMKIGVGSSGAFAVSAAGAIVAGINRLTFRHPAGGALVVKNNGTTIITSTNTGANGTGTDILLGTGSGPAGSSTGALIQTLDGALYEFRLWKTGTIPTQATLDDLADPATDWKVEGAEFGLWRLGRSGGQMDLDATSRLATATFDYFHNGDLGFFGLGSDAFVFRVKTDGTVQYRNSGDVWNNLPTPQTMSAGWNTVKLQFDTNNATPSNWFCKVFVNGFDGGNATYHRSTSQDVARINFAGSVASMEPSGFFGIDAFNAWQGHTTGASSSGTWTSNNLTDANAHHAFKLVTTQTVPAGATLTWEISRDAGASFTSLIPVLVGAAFTTVGKTSAQFRLRATMTAPDIPNAPTVEIADLYRYFTYETPQKTWKSLSLGASFKPVQMKVELVFGNGASSKTVPAATALQIDVTPDNYQNVATIADGGSATFDPALLGFPDWRVRFLLTAKADGFDTPTIAAFKLTLTPSGTGQTITYLVSRDGVTFYTVTKGVRFAGFGAGDSPKNQLYFRVDFGNLDTHSTPDVDLVTLVAESATDLTGIALGTITNYGVLVNLDSFLELRADLIQRIQDLTGVALTKKFNPATGNIEASWNNNPVPATVKLKKRDVRNLRWQQSVDGQANRIVYSGGEA